MKLSVIILNYKTPALTLACVGSLQKQYAKQLQQKIVEIIIVENGSNDGSLETIKKAIKVNAYQSVSLISSEKNLGFGGGCMVGAKHAKGDALLFLNSDTVVKDQGIMDMASFLDAHRQIGVMGGKLQNPDQSVQLSAWKFYTLPNLLLLLLGLERFGLGQKALGEVSSVDWVSGGCFMMRKDLFMDLGGFDPSLFMYIEDMELCFRVKKRGMQVAFFPNVSIIHISHGSSNRSFAIVNIYKGISYFYKKHMSGWQYAIAKLLLKTKAIILVIIGRISGNLYLSQTYAKAFSAC